MTLTGLTSTLFGYAVWMLFGATVVVHLEPVLTWRNVVFPILSLTVLRMVPVAVSLVGAGLRPRTVAFVGWFGPRGLASIIFALIAFESLNADPAITTVLSLIATTVVFSVLLHGLTSTPLAERYGAWAIRTHPTVETADSIEPLRHHGVRAAAPSSDDTGRAAP